MKKPQFKPPANPKEAIKRLDKAFNVFKKYNNVTAQDDLVKEGKQLLKYLTTELELLEKVSNKQTEDPKREVPSSHTEV